MKHTNQICRALSLTLLAAKLASAGVIPAAQNKKPTYLTAAEGQPCGLVDEELPVFAFCDADLYCSSEVNSPVLNMTCQISTETCGAENPISSPSDTFGAAQPGESMPRGDTNRPAKRNFVILPSNKETTTAISEKKCKYGHEEANEYDQYATLPPQQQRVPIEYVERLRRSRFGSVPYGKVITSCTVPGTIALTFNDGPAAYTKDLLELLDNENVNATFFVCGGNLDWDQITGHGNPAVLRRMMMSGHQIGSHTWGHPDLATMDEDKAFSQMFRNEQALLSAIGVVPTYVRPPYLSTKGETMDIMGKLGYHVISLDLDTHDWTHDYDAAEQNFLDAVDGSDPRVSSHLVLAHDIHEQTAHQFAEFMITEGKAAGYHFVTVGECLGDPMYNWYRNPYDGGPWLKHKYTAKVTKRQANEDAFYRYFKQTTYDNSSMKTSRSAVAAPTPATMEIDLTSSSSSGQLAPTGSVLKRGVGRFHRGGPLLTEYLDEIPTTTTKSTSSGVESAPAKTESIDFVLLPPPFSNIKNPLIDGDKLTDKPPAAVNKVETSIVQSEPITTSDSIDVANVALTGSIVRNHLFRDYTLADKERRNVPMTSGREGFKEGRFSKTE